MRVRSLLQMAVSVFFCAVAALPTPSTAQSTIWSNPWLVQQVPWVLPNYFFATYAPAFVTTAVAANGDVLVGENAADQDFRVIRIGPDGGIRWSVNIPNHFYDWTGFGALLPTTDGGAFVTVGNPYYTYNTLLLHIGADGTVVWSSTASAWWLTSPTDQTVVTAACGAITAYSADDGSVLWQNKLIPSTGNDCVLGGGLVSDESGNVFATMPNGTGVDAVMLDGAGQIQWQVAADNSAAPIAHPAAVSAGLLCLNTSSGVLVLHTSDGAVAWSATQSVILTLAGSPADPIVVGNDGIQRLAAANGQPRWPQPFITSVAFATVVNGKILVGSGKTLSALNPETGSVLWSATIPAQDGNGNELHLVAAGTAGANLVNALVSVRNEKPLLIQPVDSTSGQMLASQVLTATTSVGVTVSDILEAEDGNIVGVARDRVAGKPVVRMRRLDGSNGTTLWEIVHALDEFSNPNYPAIVSAIDSIAVSVEQNQGSESDSSSPGFSWVGVFEDQTGNLRWQRNLQDIGQKYTHVSEPIIDAAGDVYVAYGTNVSCATFQDPYCTNEQHTLVKLAATDGATIWRFDNTGSDGLAQVFPQTFSLAGNNIVVSGPFAGSLASHDAVELSGTDGTIRWTSDAFGGGGKGWFQSAPDGSLIGVGWNNWVKADSATGVVDWSNPRISPWSCKVGCNIYDTLVAPNGDRYDVGEGDHMPFVDYLPAAQGATEKHWRLDSAYTGLRSIIMRVDADSAGKIWLQLNRYFRVGNGGINFLAQLDPATGTMASQQALAGFSEFPFPENAIPLFVSAPENHRIKALTFTSGPPTSSTSGVALLDTTVVASGDLSISVTADHAVANPGDVIGFHVIASYDGNAPISGVHIIADPSGLGLPTTLACDTQSASNCVVGNALGVVNASFDIQPGGQVDVSGQVTVSKAPLQMLYPALVYGPTGLSERDTLNNFSTLSLTDEIFADGF